MSIQDAVDTAAITLDPYMSSIFILVGGIGLLASVGLAILRNLTYYFGTPRFVVWLPWAQRIVTTILVLTAALWVAVSLRMNYLDTVGGHPQYTLRDSSTTIALGAMLVITAVGTLLASEFGRTKSPLT